jgi:hypothetical protein
MSAETNSERKTAGFAVKSPAVGWERDKFSYSVNRALEKVEVSSGANIMELLDACKTIHKDYGIFLKETEYFQRFGKVDFSENFKACLGDTSRLRLDRYPADRWAEIALTVITAPKKNPSIRAEVPVVNTRMFVLAAVLHQFNDIYQAISGKKLFADFCYLLVVQFGAELKKTEDIIYEECLTQNGRKLHQQLRSARYKVFEIGNLSDYPTKDDSLSRSALAMYIAKRLRYIYNRDINHYGSFFMHIDGEWGSGKSTLLGFLKEALETPAPPDPQINPSQPSEGRWVVIKFNAWEHQRLDPPWWFLMKTVFIQAFLTLRRLAFKRRSKKLLQQSEESGQQVKEPWLKNLLRWFNLWFHEYKWRLYRGWVYLFIAVITLVLIVLTSRINFQPPPDTTKPVEPNAFDWQKQPVVQLIYLLGFIWSSLKFMRTSLLSGSARAAQSFEQNSKDPMAALSSHFFRLVKRVGHPMAIFIDDLDRCNRDYGIKLLEGLQTIFRNAPVVYVVAADKRWLSAMYESQYSLFAAAVAKPAKPFGTVFLDKTFQYTLELPDISATQKKLYWDALLKVKRAVETNPDSEEKVHAEVREKAASVIHKEAREQREREDIMAAVSIADEEETMEHKLKDFVELIEPNPRTMKRLINDISTTINLARLYGQEINDNQLILWTILKLQYPSLAAFFWKEPVAIDKVHAPGSKGGITGDEAFNALLKEPSVRRLFLFRVGEEEVRIDSTFLQKLKFQESE